MPRYRRDDTIKTFEEIESPRKGMTFEEKTGKKLDGKIRYHMKPLGNGYVQMVRKPFVAAPRYRCRCGHQAAGPVTLRLHRQRDCPRS